MNTDGHRSDGTEVTERIIGAAFDVWNGLGYGFLEKVYENALVHLLRKRGLKVEQQVSLKVYFDGVVVGEYCVDLFVEDTVVVELKSAKAIAPEHISQCLNYLKAMKRQVGLILNFGATKVEIKRLLNDR